MECPKLAVKMYVDFRLKYPIEVPHFNEPYVQFHVLGICKTISQAKEISKKDTNNNTNAK